jgi:voltage-gated potassium channel
MMRRLGEWKHLALLVALVVAAILEPLSFNWTESAQLIGSAVVLVLNVPVLLVVFEERWERGLAFFLLTPLIAANIMHEVLSDRLQIGAIVFHCLAAVFLAFAVAVILKRIFQRQAIRTDDVIGALCGYLLAAVAWGNAYALVYVLWPESFHVADVIAGRLADWHLQRFLFSYFSVMTLTTMGYGDITPAGSLVYSLVWLESVFGQFYIAVVVAQLVGLKLAQAIKQDRPDA